MSLKKVLPFGAVKFHIHDLRPYLDILKNIAFSTEKDFLAIGGKVQDFHQRAGEISTTASRVAETISGQEMENVQKEFSRISSMVRNLSEGMKTERETILSIMGFFDDLKQPLVNFGYIIRNLNVLCNFIKIEIARLALSDTSFFKLSADVGQLARQIETSIKSLSDQASEAVVSLHQNIAWIEKCDERQKDQGRLILEKINANLQSIAEKNKASSRMISDISGTWMRISQSIGEVVQALQFHDITRQRVEHVLEALEGLPQKLEEWEGQKGSFPFLRFFKSQGTTPEASQGGYRKYDIIADMFDLQAAQLVHADQNLQDAMEKILQSLGLVARDAAEISESILSAAGRQGGDESAFLSQMETDVQVLADSAANVSGIRQDLTSAMTSLSETAMGMSGFVKEMNTIGIEMQRLAVNARVHAAHLGEQGATLGVLAESIHQLSQETSAMVQKIMDALQAVMENAAKLSGMANAEDGDHLVHMGRDFVAILHPLKKMESDIGTLLPFIRQSGVSLSADIERLVSGIHVHEKMSEGLLQVSDYLQTAADALTLSGDQKSKRAKTGYLDDLSSKYTMHSERSTHLAAAGRKEEKPTVAALAVKDPAPAVEKNIKDASEDMGDNVELF